MILEGCQGRTKLRLTELSCPQCGETVELLSSEPFALCPECGAKVYNELVDCAARCPHAKECIGQSQYALFLEAAREKQARLAAFAQSDEW